MKSLVARRLASLLSLLADASCCVTARIQAQAPSTLDGVWNTDGYGMIWVFSGDTVRGFQVTSVSCIPFANARSATPPRGAIAAFGAPGASPAFILRPDRAADRLRVERPGTASDLVIRRVDRRPAICDTPTPDTPTANFDVFAASWAEHYPFFGERGVDWNAIVAANRVKVTATTTPQELFTILSGMIEPFHDAHSLIQAPNIQRSFSGSRRTPSFLTPDVRPRGYTLVAAHVAGPLREFCERQIEFGLLSSDVGYVRIRSFGGYSKDGRFESGLVALDAALDTIFANARSWKGLVLDLRLNTGGSDVYGLAIAGRLTDREYVAYEKQARNDPGDATKWTDPQPSMVRPSSRPGFRGPVAELIGVQSVSAAETFTQALLRRPIRTVRVGETTQGVFSDVLGRRLPNGWGIGLPNERFVTDGKSYDIVGIAPDVAVESFTPAALASGRDAGVDAALRALLGADAQRARPVRTIPAPTPAAVVSRVDSLIAAAVDDPRSPFAALLVRGTDTLLSRGDWRPMARANGSAAAIAAAIAGRPALLDRTAPAGFRGINAQFRVDSLTMILLDRLPSAALDPLLLDLTRVMLGLPVVLPAPTIGLDSATLARYTGTFSIQVPGRPVDLRLWVEGGRLLAQAQGPGQGVLSMRATAPNVFQTRSDATIKFTFIVVDGVATRMVFEQDGGRLDAIRKPGG